MKTESYPDYDAFLATSIWPGSEDLVNVESMAPQHAAAALAKLVRWAVNAPTGQVALFDEVGAREDLTRSSPLGRALAARAQNLHPGEAEALSRALAPPEAVRGELASAITDLVPGTAGLGAAAIAEVLYRRLAGRFTITVGG